MYLHCFWHFQHLFKKNSKFKNILSTCSVFNALISKYTFNVNVAFKKNQKLLGHGVQKCKQKENEKPK